MDQTKHRKPANRMMLNRTRVFYVNHTSPNSVSHAAYYGIWRIHHDHGYMTRRISPFVTQNANLLLKYGEHNNNNNYTTIYIY